MKITETTELTDLEILQLKVTGEFEGTIAEYLQELMVKLWIEREGFSGKRPWGDSGWQYDIYVALVKAHVIPGSLDEKGFIEDCDAVEADDIIVRLIKNHMWRK